MTKSKGKMRGRLKRWGRCVVPGHKQHRCEVNTEIRESTLTREQEKRQWRKESDDEVQTSKPV